MSKIYYFGKIQKTSNNNIIVSLPSGLHEVVDTSKPYVVIFEECNVHKKFTSKYRDVDKVSIRTF